MNRKPPYQQGYEDGRSDYLANEPDRKSIFDYDCYHDEPDSKDRMMYEEGYEDGFHGKESRIEPIFPIVVGTAYYKDKEVMKFSNDVGGLTIIGFWVRTDTLKDKD